MQLRTRCSLKQSSGHSYPLSGHPEQCSQACMHGSLQVVLHGGLLLFREELSHQRLGHLLALVQGMSQRACALLIWHLARRGWEQSSRKGRPSLRGFTDNPERSLTSWQRIGEPLGEPLGLALAWLELATTSPKAQDCCSDEIRKFAIVLLLIPHPQPSQAHAAL